MILRERPVIVRHKHGQLLSGLASFVGPRHDLSRDRLTFHLPKLKLEGGKAKARKLLDQSF